MVLGILVYGARYLGIWCWVSWYMVLGILVYGAGYLGIWCWVSWYMVLGILVYGCGREMAISVFAGCLGICHPVVGWHGMRGSPLTGLHVP